MNVKVLEKQLEMDQNIVSDQGISKKSQRVASELRLIDRSVVTGPWSRH